jgi:hypothetical protein
MNYLTSYMASLNRRRKSSCFAQSLKGLEQSGDFSATLTIQVTSYTMLCHWVSVLPNFKCTIIAQSIKNHSCETVTCLRRSESSATWYKNLKSPIFRTDIIWFSQTCKYNTNNKINYGIFIYVFTVKILAILEAEEKQWALNCPLT